MNGAPTLHPQELIAKSPVKRLQVLTIGICVLINMIDGFDVLAIAYTAPLISEAWSVGPAQLGLVFGAGGFGMMLGAFLLGPMADYKGRRFNVIIGLVLATLGVFATIFTNTVTELMLARILTGVGIGSLLASLNTLVAEYSSERYRNISITMLHLGYPIGGAIGGLAAASLISQFGWQSVFLVGGLLSLFLLPICILILPESVDFLLARRGKNALPKVNRIMRRLGYDEYQDLPEPRDSEKEDSLGFRRLLSKDLLLPNLLLPLAFFMLMVQLYFVLQWLPKLVVELGHSIEQGIQVSVLTSSVSAIGMLLFGLAATRFDVKKVEVWWACIATIAMLLLGFYSSSQYMLLLVFVAFMGLTHSGLMPGLYAIAPRAYPASARAAGISVSIGVARLGAVVGPSLAGFLLAKGVSPGSLLMIFALPLIVPAFVVSLIPYFGQEPQK